jgi:ribulose bisphosphate carboxylase small subunit
VLAEPSEQIGMDPNATATTGSTVVHQPDGSLDLTTPDDQLASVTSTTTREAV